MTCKLDNTELGKVLALLSDIQLEEFVFNLRTLLERAQVIESESIHLNFPQHEQGTGFGKQRKSRLQELVLITNKFKFTRSCVANLLDTLSSRQWCSILMSILKDGDPKSINGTQIGQLFDNLGLCERDRKVIQGFDFNYFDQYCYSDTEALGTLEN